MQICYSRKYITQITLINFSIRNISSGLRVKCNDDCMCSCSKLFENVDKSALNGKNVDNTTEGSKLPYNHTSCSKKAYTRGRGQKVIKLFVLHEIFCFNKLSLKIVEIIIF